MIDVAILMLVVDNHIVNAPKLMDKCHRYYPAFPIYVLDNTNRAHEPFPEYVHVYRNDTDNKTTAWSRKLLVEKVDHEFIWFLDDDDDIYGVEFSDFSSDYDIHNFGFVQVRDDINSGEYTRIPGHTTIPLWASFLRTSLVKQAQAPIDISIRAVCNEDDYVTKVVYKLADKIQYHDNLYPYISNSFASNSFVSSYDCPGGYRKFVAVLQGRKAMLELARTNWPDFNITFDDDFYIMKLFRTKGLYLKELLLEALFDAGLDQFEMYNKVFTMQKDELIIQLQAEAVVLMKNLFPEFEIKKECFRRVETMPVKNEYGKRVNVVVREWTETIEPNWEEFAAL